MARRGKSDNPLAWIFTIMILIPIAVSWLLKQIATLVFVGVKKSNTKRTSRSNYSRSSTTNKTHKSQSTQRAQNRTTTKTKTANTSKTYSGENTISLYEALRIPGDPDPAFGGCTCFVNVSSINNTTAYYSNTTTDYEYENEYDSEETGQFNEDIDIDEKDAMLMGLAVHDMFVKQKDKKGKDSFYEDTSDYIWEAHCEYCGELLEDCVCDHRHESHEAISSCNRGFDGGWGFSRRDDDRDGLADFDEFRSF